MNAKERKELGKKFEEEMKKIGIRITDIPEGTTKIQKESKEVWIIKDNGKR